METNELRVGNYIYGVSERIEFVISILKNNQVETTKPPLWDLNFINHINDLSSISLTSDILLKSGFKLDNNTYYTYSSTYFSIARLPLTNGEELLWITIGGESIKLDTVHKLQNIFYLIYNYELQITL